MIASSLICCVGGVVAGGGVVRTAAAGGLSDNSPRGAFLKASSCFRPDLGASLVCSAISFPDCPVMVSPGGRVLLLQPKASDRNTQQRIRTARQLILFRLSMESPFTWDLPNKALMLMATWQSPLLNYKLIISLSPAIGYPRALGINRDNFRRLTSQVLYRPTVKLKTGQALTAQFSSASLLLATRA